MRGVCDRSCDFSGKDVDVRPFVWAVTKLDLAYGEREKKILHPLNICNIYNLSK